MEHSFISNFIYLLMYYPSQILGWLTNSGWFGIVALLVVFALSFFSGIYKGVELRHKSSVITVIPNVVFPIKLAVLTHFLINYGGFLSSIVILIGFLILQSIFGFLLYFITRFNFPVFMRIAINKIGLESDEHPSMGVSLIKISIIHGVASFLLEILTVISMPFILLGYFCHENKFFIKIANFFDDVVEEESQPWISVATGEEENIASDIQRSDYADHIRDKRKGEEEKIPRDEEKIKRLIDEEERTRRGFY